jgi:hypothetical protein
VHCDPNSSAIAACTTATTIITTAAATTTTTTHFRLSANPTALPCLTHVPAFAMSPMPAMAMPRLNWHLDSMQVWGPLAQSHDALPRYTAMPIQSDTMGKKQNHENQVNAWPKPMGGGVARGNW